MNDLQRSLGVLFSLIECVFFLIEVYTKKHGRPIRPNNPPIFMNCLTFMIGQLGLV